MVKRHILGIVRRCRYRRWGENEGVSRVSMNKDLRGKGDKEKFLRRRGEARRGILIEGKGRCKRGQVVSGFRFGEGEGEGENTRGI